MFRISYKMSFIIVLSFFIVIFVSGCSKDVQCEAASDCSQITCSTASCVDNQCKYTAIPDCCGNQIKESIEDGRQGNSCTCPQDYGNCEGKAELTSGSRTYESQYLERFCRNDQCVLSVPSEKVRPLTLLDERDFSFFTLETTVTYNEPFDVNQDTFAFRLTLTDDNEYLVFPVKLNKVVLKDGEILFGEKDLNLVLNKVGDSVTVNVPLLYRLEQPEETRGLTYDINYEYSKKIIIGKEADGSNKFGEELVRDDYQKRFSTKLILVSGQ